MISEMLFHRLVYLVDIFLFQNIQRQFRMDASRNLEKEKKKYHFFLYFKYFII